MSGSIAITLNVPSGEQNTREVIEHAVEALAESNLIYLAKNPRVPPLARAGIKYRHDKTERPELWLSIPEVIARGWADCKCLAAWRIAELRVRGIVASPRISNCRNLKYLKSCGAHYHVAVNAIIGGRPVVMDPSKELGM